MPASPRYLVNFINTFKNRFDIIVSNPPYVKKKELKSLQQEVLNFEPKLALLDATNDGVFYHKIAQISKYLLKENGAVFVEIGFGNTKEVKEIFLNQGFCDIKIKNDLAGIERALYAKI